MCLFKAICNNYFFSVTTANYINFELFNNIGIQLQDITLIVTSRHVLPIKYFEIKGT